MTHTIVSKRTSPFTYQQWAKVNGQFHRVGRGIIINGGAGIVGGAELLSGIPLDKRSSLIPVGVHTYVDDEALDYLMGVPKFRDDIKRGIICVIKGKKLDQDGTDNVAEKEMIEDSHIPTRPVTQEEMEAAGAIKTKDGAMNIEGVADGDSPMRQRRIDAGSPSYVKKRNAETKKATRGRRK